MKEVKIMITNGLCGIIVGITFLTGISIAFFILSVAIRDRNAPKKPAKTRKGEIVCPTCRTLIGTHPYCKYCGQALDWGDTK